MNIKINAVFKTEKSSFKNTLLQVNISTPVFFLPWINVVQKYFGTHPTIEVNLHIFEQPQQNVAKPR
jgi:hypothetical protein